MRRSVLLLTLCALPGLAQEPAAPRAPAPIVFFDIAGEDSAALADFYASVFDWQIAADGSLTTEVKSPPLVPRADYASASGFTTSVTAPLPGQIRQDPSEKRIYLGVPDVAATLRAIEATGGTVEAERFAVPGVVVLGLFRDPAGNPMGLVEMNGEHVRIP